jgi:hypothetical protein
MLHKYFENLVGTHIIAREKHERLLGKLEGILEPHVGLSRFSRNIVDNDIDVVSRVKHKKVVVCPFLHLELLGDIRSVGHLCWVRPQMAVLHSY